MKQTVLGIIPARGGSKGVPRKNVRPMLGRPLIAYTIEAALQALSIGRVMVSTDDAEIAAVARRCGAEVPFLRPAEFATDTASSLSVIRHALSWLALNEGYRPEAVVILPPTSPLRTAEDIDGTVDLFRTSHLDSAVTVVPVQDHPYFIFSRSEEGEMAELIRMDEKPLRRQELPEFFTHSQAVIVSRTDYLDGCGETDPIFNLHSLAGYPVDRDNAMDIDTPSDFALVEARLGKRRAARQAVA
jgi:CMP-N,N'-diacetyllegionaminic acid synthase